MQLCFYTRPLILIRLLRAKDIDKRERFSYNIVVA
jgi:hypothetical protein